MVELQAKLHTLSEKTQLQAEELVVWRLASQSAPTFHPLNTEKRSESQDVVSAVRGSQSDQQQTEGMTKDQEKTQMQNPGVQEGPGNVTVVRGDEILLSGSSNRLQGRMLFSR